MENGFIFYDRITGNILGTIHANCSDMDRFVSKAQGRAAINEINFDGFRYDPKTKSLIPKDQQPPQCAAVTEQKAPAPPPAAACGYVPPPSIKDEIINTISEKIDNARISPEQFLGPVLMKLNTIQNILAAKCATPTEPPQPVAIKKSTWPWSKK